MTRQEPKSVENSLIYGYLPGIGSNGGLWMRSELSFTQKKPFDGYFIIIFHQKACYRLKLDHWPNWPLSEPPKWPRGEPVVEDSFVLTSKHVVQRFILHDFSWIGYLQPWKGSMTDHAGLPEPPGALRGTYSRGQYCVFTPKHAVLSDSSFFMIFMNMLFTA